MTYLWDDGVSAADRTGILPGERTVTVTDANGCVQVLDVTVGVTGD
ncbi:MAG: hypothetical protein MZV63_35835 [Marinilabiliales bacterium]|nr:hypothetical protein [Marinilabiliales bacterium]